MELRHYWRVLWRRRKIVRNVFLLAFVIAALTTSYTIYTSFYEGSTVIDVQMQPESARVTGAVVDPLQASHQNTDQVVTALGERATEQAYFSDVAAALKKQGINMSWQAIGSGLDVHTGKTHAMYINWQDPDPHRATTIVAAAAQVLLDWVPVWHRHLMPNSPQILTSIIQPAYYQRIHLTKTLADLGLKTVLGLAAAVILAYLFEYLDDTVQDELDVERWTGLPTLGVIPGGRRERRARSA